MLFSFETLKQKTKFSCSIIPLLETASFEMASLGEDRSQGHQAVLP